MVEELRPAVVARRLKEAPEAVMLLDVRWPDER